MSKDGDKGGWKEFIWNSRTREFMGRTASSWGLIFVFYVIFYTFLAGLFALTMYVMLLTLDDHKPTWQDRLATPGMVISPKADETYVIKYNIKKTESWDTYVTSLNNFLSSYDDAVQVLKNDVCVPNQYYEQNDSGGVKNNPKRSCQFNRTLLEECSGITDGSYGYDQGKPCIIVKLNRVIGLHPGLDGQAPKVTCYAKADDGDKIGNITYFPSDASFNLMYYPYYGKKAQVNYSQPLVAVKFESIAQNEHVNVECKINANNIPVATDRDKFAGKVSFVLMIENKG